MPIIEVRWFAGRTPQQKAEIVKRFTETIVEVGRCRSQDVEVIFHDMKPSDWAQDGRLHEPPA